MLSTLATYIVSSFASITVVNVTEFELHNVTLINCGKTHTAFVKQKNSTESDVNNSMRVKYNYRNSSVLLYHCELVKIVSVNISVNAHFDGTLAMNVMKSLIIDNIKVQLECSGNLNLNHSIYGILLYYKNKGGKGRTM